jgi:predicted small lipoprotein YifL
MKNILRPTFALAVFILSLAACTAGDKGSEKVADSVRIDTTKTSGGTGGSGTSVDSSTIDTAATPGSVSRDTSQKNRSGNSAADYKPNKK